jgi:glycerol-3-phosphate dehydrogenase (NAD(P)+)
LAQQLNQPEKIAVIGGGSWATAIIKILSENNVAIQWWLRNKEAVQHIRKYHHNPHYLSDIAINRRKVKPCTDIKEAVKDVSVIILAVPAAFVSDALSSLVAADFKGKLVVSAIKGMIPGDNILVTDLVERDYGVPPSDLCVIAGPCHAEEVALEKQSYLTIGCPSLDNARRFASLLNCRYVKTTVSEDLYGIEYCAVMKNIVALACGICHGLNFGDNFQAVLVSTALQEIKRFLDTVYPLQRDLNESAYVGDLLVTAYSQFSRNRTFGNMIGRGYSVISAQIEMNMVAEGYYAVKSVHQILLKHQIKMPITETVYNILYEHASPGQEVQLLKDSMN